MTLLTADEAKTKWCPLARATDLAERPVSVNRRGKKPDTDCFCIASACMAWRKTEDYVAQVVVLSNVSAWEASGWKVAEQLEDNKVRMSHPLFGSGYCGAFGKPNA